MFEYLCIDSGVNLWIRVFRKLNNTVVMPIVVIYYLQILVRTLQVVVNADNQCQYINRSFECCLRLQKRICCKVWRYSSSPPGLPIIYGKVNIINTYAPPTWPGPPPLETRPPSNSFESPLLELAKMYTVKDPSTNHPTRRAQVPSPPSKRNQHIDLRFWTL